MKKIMFPLNVINVFFSWTYVLLYMLYAFVNNVLSLDILMKNKVPRKRIKRKKYIATHMYENFLKICWNIYMGGILKSVNFFWYALYIIL